MQTRTGYLPFDFTRHPRLVYALSLYMM